MKLLQLYVPLVGLVLLGFVLSSKLPKVYSTYLGQFLFWVGVPISIVAFLRRADLSGPIWIAPVVAWIAILLGAGLARAWIGWQKGRRDGGAEEGTCVGGFTDLSKVSVGQGSRGESIELNSSDSSGFSSACQAKPLRLTWSKQTQGSFILSAMVGNTGYLGYPVTLAFVGTQYFGWALFYDLLGSTLGSQILGIALAARFGGGFQSHWQIFQALLTNPALWSLGFGLGFRQIPLPDIAEQSLQNSAWTIVAASLILIGMRLRQISSWRSLSRASVSLGIKMLLVPLILGSSLSLFGLKGAPQLVIVLQMAMPPAVITLVIAEVYNLDRDLAVTAIAVGAVGLLLTLPLWLWLF